MARVTGVGGVFLRSHDPQRLMAWYGTHLGIKVQAWGAVMKWTDEVPARTGATAWNVFPENTTYFSASSDAAARAGNESAAESLAAEHAPQQPPPTPQQVMIDYRVDDLDALLAGLTRAGVWIDPKRQDEGYGKFAWIKDCDGNRIELWQPAAAH